MASERIDPRDYPGEPISLDHYARYAFAGQFVLRKRVLDAACGVGYGSEYLRTAGAKTVLGIDLSVEAIHSARERFTGNGLTFELADVHCLSKTFPGPWDVIASFETIEHLTDPRQFIVECGAVLAPGGILVASVPNPAQDPEGANEFHIQRFTGSSFEDLLRATFAFVEIRPQYFCLASLVNVDVRAPVANLSTFPALSGSTVTGAAEPEGFIAVCANDRTPSMHQSVLVHARKFWEHHQNVLLGKSWLEEQFANSQHREAELATEMERRNAQLEELVAAKHWLEQERARWQKTATELVFQIEQQQATFEELERAKLWLEEERGRWQTKAAELLTQLEQETHQL